MQLITNTPGLARSIVMQYIEKQVCKLCTPVLVLVIEWKIRPTSGFREIQEMHFTEVLICRKNHTTILVHFESLNHRTTENGTCIWPKEGLRTIIDYMTEVVFERILQLVYEYNWSLMSIDESLIHRIQHLDIDAMIVLDERIIR